MKHEPSETPITRKSLRIDIKLPFMGKSIKNHLYDYYANGKLMTMRERQIYERGWQDGFDFRDGNP